MTAHMVLDRRTFVAAFAALGSAAGWARPVGQGASTPGIAVTIDDFDLSDTVLMTGENRDEAIRNALKRHRVKAAGFVAGKYSMRR